jgi:LPS export ABC transporter protein LptC
MASAVRNVLLLTVLTAAAVITWLLSRPEPEIPEVTRGGADVPLGYYMRDAVILGTDTSGAVLYRVYATLAEQPQDGDNLVLTGVRVEYDSAEAIQWLATAGRATASVDGSYLRLYDGVRLSNDPGEGAEPIVIEGEELDLDPASYLASTARPVTFSRGEAILQALRFNADLREDTIDLEGVHAQFHH